MCRDCVASGCFAAYHKALIDKLSEDVANMAVEPSSRGIRYVCWNTFDVTFSYRSIAFSSLALLAGQLKGIYIVKILYPELRFFFRRLLGDSAWLTVISGNLKTNRFGTQTETNETVFWYNVNFDCEMGSLVTVLTPPSPRVHLGAFNGQTQEWKTTQKDLLVVYCFCICRVLHSWEVSLEWAGPQNMKFCLSVLSYPRFLLSIFCILYRYCILLWKCLLHMS